MRSDTCPQVMSLESASVGAEDHKLSLLISAAGYISQC